MTITLLFLPVRIVFSFITLQSKSFLYIWILHSLSTLCGLCNGLTSRGPDVLCQSRWNFFFSFFWGHFFSRDASWLSPSCTCNRSPGAAYFPLALPMPRFQWCWVSQTLLCWLSASYSHKHMPWLHDATLQRYVYMYLAYKDGILMGCSPSVSHFLSVIWSMETKGVSLWWRDSWWPAVIVFASVLTCVINYPECCADEKGLEARRSRFVQLGLAEEIGFSFSSVCWLWIPTYWIWMHISWHSFGSEAEGRAMNRGEPVHTHRDTAHYCKRNLQLAFSRTVWLCLCVGAYDNTKNKRIKRTLVWPVCVCVGAQCDIRYYIHTQISLSSCLTQV